MSQPAIPELTIKAGFENVGRRACKDLRVPIESLEPKTLGEPVGRQFRERVDKNARCLHSSCKR